MKLTEHIVLGEKQVTRTYEAETVGEIVDLRSRIRDEKHETTYVFDVDRFNSGKAARKTKR